MTEVRLSISMLIIIAEDSVIIFLYTYVSHRPGRAVNICQSCSGCRLVTFKRRFLGIRTGAFLANIFLEFSNFGITKGALLQGRVYFFPRMSLKTPLSSAEGEHLWR